METQFKHKRTNKRITILQEWNGIIAFTVEGQLGEFTCLSVNWNIIAEAI